MATCHFSSLLPRADQHPGSSRQVLLPTGPQADCNLCSGSEGRLRGEDVRRTGG